MAGRITLQLREPIAGHGEPITQVVLRAPRLLEYAQHGEPYSFVPGSDGQMTYVEHDTAIAAYVEVCVVEPKDKLLLTQVELPDAMAIKEAVLGFFGEARRALK